MGLPGGFPVLGGEKALYSTPSRTYARSLESARSAADRCRFHKRGVCNRRGCDLGWQALCRDNSPLQKRRQGARWLIDRKLCRHSQVPQPIPRHDSWVDGHATLSSDGRRPQRTLHVAGRSTVRACVYGRLGVRVVASPARGGRRGCRSSWPTTRVDAARKFLVAGQFASLHQLTPVLFPRLVTAASAGSSSALV